MERMASVAAMERAREKVVVAMEAMEDAREEKEVAMVKVVVKEDAVEKGRVKEDAMEAKEAVARCPRKPS